VKGLIVDLKKKQRNMSGKEKNKVFVYTIDGKFKEKHESTMDFCRKYNYSKSVLSTGNRNKYVLTECGHVAVLERIGKQAVRDLIKRHNSPYILKARRSDKYSNVEIYNLDNELIATFSDITYFRKLVNLKFTYPILRDSEIRTRDGLIIRFLKK
jgi:hypothetical protein